MPSSFVRPTAFWLLLVLLLPLAACDNTEPPEQTDVIVGGLNITQLFAPATDAEIQTVRADWAARDLSVRDAQIVAESQDEDGARLVVLSHTMTGIDGADFTHYGAVRIPDGGANLPVLVVHHGGDGGFALGGDNPNGNVAGMVDAYPALFAATVQVLPTYRSEPLGTTGVPGLGTTYTSGGAPSPWDYDVDDSIALLGAALQLFADETDADRIGAMGFSRGSTVALLMAVRDQRVQAVSEYYGVADFYDDTTQQLAIGAVLGSPAALSLPGAEYIRGEILNPLVDGTLPYSEGRLPVVRRSASLFTADLPALQVHHHEDDPTVPFAQSVALNTAISTTPNDGAYDYNTYNGALPSGVMSAHNPLAMPASLPDTEAFFQTNMIGSGAFALWPAN